MRKTIAEFLEEELNRRKEQNPRYSLRAFARHLEIESSHLSKVLRGQRPVTWSIFEKIKDKLELEPHEIRQFEETIGAEAERGYAPIKNEAISAIKGWQDIVICAFGLLSKNGFTALAVQEYFKMSNEEIEESLERLVDIGLLDYDMKGSYFTAKSKITTVGVPTQENLMKIQEAFLIKSISALKSIDESKRDHSGMTFSLGEDELLELKQKIKKFRREVVDWSDASDRKKEVYHLSISVFPLRG